MILKYENLEENGKTSYICVCVCVCVCVLSITQYIQILFIIKFCLVQVS